jgi:hypothetical protein
LPCFPAAGAWPVLLADDHVSVCQIGSTSSLMPWEMNNPRNAVLNHRRSKTWRERDHGIE